MKTYSEARIEELEKGLRDAADGLDAAVHWLREAEHHNSANTVQAYAARALEVIGYADRTKGKPPEPLTAAGEMKETDSRTSADRPNWDCKCDCHFTGLARHVDQPCCDKPNTIWPAKPAEAYSAHPVAINDQHDGYAALSGYCQCSRCSNARSEERG